MAYLVIYGTLMTDVGKFQINSLNFWWTWNFTKFEDILKELLRFVEYFWSLKILLLHLDPRSLLGNFIKKIWASQIAYYKEHWSEKSLKSLNFEIFITI